MAHARPAGSTKHITMSTLVMSTLRAVTGNRDRAW